VPEPLPKRPTVSPDGFRPLHVERTGAFTLPLALAEAFPLFSPEGERTWVTDWDPAYLHPSHPSSADGTVFRTSHNQEETFWLVIRYDPDQGVAEYGRFTPGSRMGTVKVCCHQQTSAQTRVSVTYSLTALTEAGNTVVADMAPEKYDRMLSAWREAIMRRLGAGRDSAAT